MRRTLLAALLAAAVLASVVPALLHFVAVDRCLDAGGVFDYSARICRGDVESLPVPRPEDNADFVSSAIAILVVVATASVTAPIGSSRFRRFVRLRDFVRGAGVILLLAWGLVALNGAAASAWLSGGPPTEQPRAWWGQAVRCFWTSVSYLFTAVWLAVALRPRGSEERAIEAPRGPLGE